MTTSTTTTTFRDFPLAEGLQTAVEQLGYTTPTPIQAQAIPAAINGQDILATSKTGSGKTAAFLLPALNRLADQVDHAPKLRHKAEARPKVLVLSPTRELTQQVAQDAIKLVRSVRGIRIATIVGGMPFGKQIAQLAGAQVVIATPGRLLDLVNRRQLSLADVQLLILDEADRMLDLGFSEDLETINRMTSHRDQTLMFSATFASEIIKLAEAMTENPVRISIASEDTTNKDITQTLHWANDNQHKRQLLEHWLKDETIEQAIIFASTQEETDRLADELNQSGYEVISLHGAMPQSVRNRRLKTLREGRARILVATDVAARGLDVPTITHVFNYGLPMKSEDYVHRIGRTGRAGRKGNAITFATYRDTRKIKALEDFLKDRLDVRTIAGLEPSAPPKHKPGQKPQRRNRPGGARPERSEPRTHQLQGDKRYNATHTFPHKPKRRTEGSDYAADGVKKPSGYRSSDSRGNYAGNGNSQPRGEYRSKSGDSTHHTARRTSGNRDYAPSRPGQSRNGNSAPPRSRRELEEIQF